MVEGVVLKIVMKRQLLAAIMAEVQISKGALTAQVNYSACLLSKDSL